MKALLLDTHILIWWLTAPNRLGRKAYAQIEQADVAISVVGLWEMDGPDLHGPAHQVLKPTGSLYLHCDYDKYRAAIVAGNTTAE